MAQESMSSDITTLRDRVLSWKQTRKHVRAAMPAELWEDAARLARRYTIAQVAGPVGINPTHLKRKMGSAKKQAQRRKARPRQEFVSLDMGARIGAMSEIEIENSRGVKLRLKGTGIDLESLLQKFMG